MKRKLPIYTFVVIVFLLVAISIGSYKIQYDKKPGLKKDVLNAEYIYSFYVSSKPQIQNNPYYGDPSASITVTAFLDIESEASRYFMKEIFPKLEEDYINTGKVKFFHKTYITLEDIEQKNNNFKYAISLNCLNKIDRDNYYPIFFDLFSTNLEDINILLEKYDISINNYDTCINENNLDEIYQESSEIERLGLVGINQRFYIGIAGIDNTVLDGIPKYAKFQRTLRQYELQIGT